MLTFQEIILRLQNFWCKRGCALQQSYDTETGAGTFNPYSFLYAIGPEPFNVCNVEISRRPTDGRYGENPNRLQQFHQFQVVMKPTPKDFQKIYLESLEAIGLKLKNHDIRFVHDDWESPTQGAWGLGWEVWCDGMEITQFTYFQSVGGIELKPIAVELAYGIERIVMFLQGVDNIYKVQYNEFLQYGDIYLDREKEYSRYNFDEANIDMWKNFFQSYEKEAKSLLAKNLPIPAYDFAIKASHAFNMMDARGAVSQNARVELMHRIKALCCQAAEKYLEIREALGFPLLDKAPPIYVETPSSSFSSPKRLGEKEDFLLEVGSEELPATFVEPAAKQLETMLRSLLEKLELPYEKIEIYATPRRLAAIVKNLSSHTKGKEVSRKGPKSDIAFDSHGELTAQGKGFFTANQLKLCRLEAIQKKTIPHLSLENGYLIIKETKPQLSAFKLLMENLPNLVLNIPFKKRMRWEHSDSLYARPIRWVVALFGKYVIPFSVADISSGQTSYGHAQTAPGPIVITHPNKYVSRLKKQKVIVCPSERCEFIKMQLAKIIKQEGLDIEKEDVVTAEVLYLSEYPILGMEHFNDRFLSLPDELLVSEMIDHQRYYPLKNKHGGIVNTFIVAVDKKPSSTILRNNRAVLEARLSDGFFLYQQDTKRSLSALHEKLKEVVFHEKLGTLYDKVERVSLLAEKISHSLNIPYLANAALYCKADITSAVVGEFPELQGVIGKHYAFQQGESDEVAWAIEQHWWPLNDHSPTATNNFGAVLAIADKCDTLTSYMSVGITASSSKDPYGLRRAARGIIRTLIDKKWSLCLSTICSNPDTISFIMQRLVGVLTDYDLSKEEISLCLTPSCTNPYDVFCRASALHSFRKSSKDFDHFYEIYKRAKGQVEKEKSYVIDASMLQEKAETTLYEKLEEISPALTRQIEDRNYLPALQTLSSLNRPLDQFFEEVRVQVEDQNLRENRIALLQQVFELTKSLIDFSRLTTQK